MTSLLRILPDLVDEGRAVAERALAQAGSRAAGDAPGLVPEVTNGLLIHGDNLAALAELVVDSAGTAKLVYLDPPFDSKADYRSRILTQTTDGETHALHHIAYSDRWSDGTADYLRMLIPRLVLATRLVAADGAIIVHLDWHASHLVRLVLDELLGRDAFVNHLVWSYRSGGASRTTSVPRKHDDLLVYRGGAGFRVRPLIERQYLDKAFIGSKQDASGRHYVDTILRDVLEGVKVLVNEEGEVSELSVRPVLNVSGERTGYATQKPEGLLEVLLRWTTAPGELVVDAFAGSGTTPLVAEKLRRRWIGIDANAHSIAVTRSRLDRVGARYDLRRLNETSNNAALPGSEAVPTSEATANAAAQIRTRVEAGQEPAEGRDRTARRIHLESFRPESGLEHLLTGMTDDILADPHATVAGWTVHLSDATSRAVWRTASGALETTIAIDDALGGEWPHPVAVEVTDLVGRVVRATAGQLFK